MRHTAQQVLLFQNVPSDSFGGKSLHCGRKLFCWSLSTLFKNRNLSLCILLDQYDQHNHTKVFELYKHGECQIITDVP